MIRKVKKTKLRTYGSESVNKDTGAGNVPQETGDEEGKDDKAEDNGDETMNE